MPRRQHGFTLVEIAIVLVVVGLLLGGILKGQDLVNGARVRNLADMNAGVQAAYYGFIDRYRQVPGDMTAAAAASAIGDAAGAGTEPRRAEGARTPGPVARVASSSGTLPSCGPLVSHCPPRKPR